jgi:hypothetical protein
MLHVGSEKDHTKPYLLAHVLVSFAAWLSRDKMK